jgi:hypothetical protein
VGQYHRVHPHPMKSKSDVQLSGTRGMKWKSY